MKLDVIGHKSGDEVVRVVIVLAQIITQFNFVIFLCRRDEFFWKELILVQEVIGTTLIHQKVQFWASVRGWKHEFENGTEKNDKL